MTGTVISKEQGDVQVCVQRQTNISPFHITDYRVLHTSYLKLQAHREPNVDIYISGSSVTFLLWEQLLEVATVCVSNVSLRRHTVRHLVPKHTNTIKTNQLRTQSLLLPIKHRNINCHTFENFILGRKKLEKIYFAVPQTSVFCL